MQIGLTLMAERFYAKGKARDLLQWALLDLYYSVDYRLICPKEVLPILCGSIPPSLPSAFYWHCLSAYAAKNQASLAKGKCRSGWVIRILFRVIRENITDK